MEAKEVKNNYSDEYNKLFENSENSFISKRQWNEEGDHIEKFTIYEDYTPVKTSSDTSLT